MTVGKVPHVQGIFNLPAEKFYIRPVSLGLDYLNDFTVPAARVSLGRRGGTCKNATDFFFLWPFLALFLFFHRY